MSYRANSLVEEHNLNSEGVCTNSDALSIQLKLNHKWVFILAKTIVL